MKKLSKSQLIEQLDAIEEQESREFQEAHIDSLQARYAGKYFKYENGYDKADRWMKYIKVDKLLPDTLYKLATGEPSIYYSGWSFEITSDGTVNVETEKKSYVHLLQVEITFEEFVIAYNKMIHKLPSLR